MPKATLRVYWSLYVGLFVLFVAAGGVALWYHAQVVPRMQTSLTVPDEPRSLQNAVWLEHAWVEEGVPIEEIELMAEQLKVDGFTDAFFHVGPLDANGMIAPKRYVGADRLLQVMKSVAPEVRTQAWMGQVTTTWNGPLDLEKQANRAQIVETARALLDVGFDGIHVNLEPILDGDQQFLSLLEELQEETKPRGKVLSVSSDDIEPVFGAEFLIHTCCGNVTFWSPSYLVHVLGFVDQVAVMTYDSSLQDPLLYSWYVALTSERLASLVPDGKTIFIGIPTFETGNAQFRPDVENIRSGLSGVIAGLDRAAKTSGIGVALYAYWETSEEEWEIYRNYWLGKRE